MIIKTERLVLRPLCSEDLYTTHEYAGNIENTRFMLYLPNKTTEDTKRFLSMAESEWKSETPSFYEFAIMFGDNHVGTISIYRDMQNNEAELGWILHKDYWGKGYALEAALAAKQIAIETLKIKKLVAHCDHRNKNSEKLMLAIGMTLESSDGVRTYPDGRGSAGELKYSLTM